MKVKGSRVDSMVMKMEAREVVGEVAEMVEEGGAGAEEGIKETRQVKSEETRVVRVAKSPTRGKR